MSLRLRRHKVGDLRPSQLLFSFGVGAVVDLPNLSVMVMGLEDWDVGRMRAVEGARLLTAVRAQLGEQVEALRAPPVVDEEVGGWNPLDDSATIGVPVAPFPRWLRCPWCDLLSPLGSGLFELKTDAYRPERSRYVHANCQKAKRPPVALPARFLVACEHGHLDDFPWVAFVHKWQIGCRAVLRLRELGVSGEAADVEVKCDTCGAARRMADAFGEEGRRGMPQCRGRRPHLRDFDDRPCPENMKAILLGASNGWFPIALSALTVPTVSGRLGHLVEQHWPLLANAATREVLEAFQRIGQLGAFAEFSLDEVWTSIEARRSASAAARREPTDEDKDIKTPEWEVFSNPDPSRNSDDFQLRPVEPPAGYGHQIARVVLAERLREVRALIGFTRIESPGDFSDTLEVPADRRGPISRRAPLWVPSSEVRGEGIFIQFQEAALASWCTLPLVSERNRELLEAHTAWRSMRRIAPPEAAYPGIRYVLLHTFAHALMRQLSLECGYTAASIRERIYSRPPGEDGRSMAGVLIYTAAPDSEGTLGGLVGLGESRALVRHIEQALEQARLCASDPLCSEHHPHRDGITLHGAACHACLFAPETSCERGNGYLDRSVLVSTFDQSGRGFFERGA